MLRRHGNREDRKLAKECAEVMASWPSRAVACRLYSSGSVLPLDIWIQILQTLCRDIESNGVRSASVIARDICNASMASKEMWTASQIALKHLSSLCPLSPPLRKYEQSWNQYFASPTSMQASEISALMVGSVGTVRCDALGLPWDQPACTVLFLKKFHLYRPTNTPFRLILAVQHERAPSLLMIRLLLQIESRLSIPDPSAGLKRVLQHPMSKHVTDKEFRRLLTQLGIQVMADLEQTFVTKQRQTQFFKQLVVMLEHELSQLTKHDQQSFVWPGSRVGHIYLLLHQRAATEIFCIHYYCVYVAHNGQCRGPGCKRAERAMYASSERASLGYKDIYQCCTINAMTQSNSDMFTCTATGLRLRFASLSSAPTTLTAYAFVLKPIGAAVKR